MESAIDPMVGGCDPRHQIEVHAALALSLVYTEGNSETHDYIGRFVSDTSTLANTYSICGLFRGAGRLRRGSA